MARKEEPTKSVCLTFVPGEIYTINWRILYQDSESNKVSRGETNKITKAILEIPQQTFLANIQVKVPSAFQSVYQVTSKPNIK